MQITIDTSEKLSDVDAQTLLSLLAANGIKAVDPAAETQPAAKTATPARTRKAAATPPPAEPEDEDEDSADDEGDEDASGDEDEDLLGSKKPTLDDAIAKATALVGDGKSAQVKKALVAIGAKRVSEIKATQVPAFLKALG